MNEPAQVLTSFPSVLSIFRAELLGCRAFVHRSIAPVTALSMIVAKLAFVCYFAGLVGAVGGEGSGKRSTTRCVL